MNELTDWEKEEQEHIIVENKKRVDKQYLINPQGKVIKLIFDDNFPITEDIISYHYAIARQVLPNNRDAETQLMSEGWIMIGSSVYNIPIARKRPTALQERTLINLDLYDRFCVLHKGYYLNYKENYAIFED